MSQTSSMNDESNIKSNDDQIVELMRQLKTMKSQFGFMEYFYAGVLFSQNISQFQTHSNKAGND